jgi:signal transduction protein with GAF and PtsI domain
MTHFHDAITQHLTEVKLTLAALVGFSAWLADASTELNLQGVDEMGVKAMLAAALVYVGKLFLDAQKAHKAEMKETWDAHKKDAEAREAKYCAALESNSEQLGKLVNLTSEQTEYFKTVTRNIVDEKLKGVKPQLPG